MNLILDSITEIEKVKSDVIDFLDQKGISYNIVDADNCDRICICFGNSDDKSSFCDSSITIDSCNKDVYRIHPNEIIYIAIEQRKSVLYLTNERRIETNYNISFWSDILPFENFSKPHNSYIVNLNYAEKVTQDFVYLKNSEQEYKIYTSQRKVNSFKKDFLHYNKR